MRMLTALLLLTTSLLSLGALLSGSGYSERVLPGGLPVGNLLAAVGLCALAGTAVLLSPPNSMRHRASSWALFVAASWLPLSIALAGNLALNFSGTRGITWLTVSSLTIAAVLGSFLWAVIGLLLGSWRKSSAA